MHIKTHNRKKRSSSRADTESSKQAPNPAAVTALHPSALRLGVSLLNDVLQFAV